MKPALSGVATLLRFLWLELGLTMARWESVLAIIVVMIGS